MGEFSLYYEKDSKGFLCNRTNIVIHSKTAYQTFREWDNYYYMQAAIYDYRREGLPLIHLLNTSDYIINVHMRAIKTRRIHDPIVSDYRYPSRREMVRPGHDIFLDLPVDTVWLFTITTEKSDEAIAVDRGLAVKAAVNAAKAGAIPDMDMNPAKKELGIIQSFHRSRS